MPPRSRRRYASDEHLRRYRGPVAILVGGKDRLVPEKYGRRLFDSYAGPKRLWRIPQANHKTIHEPGAEIWNEVVAFWETNRFQTAGASVSGTEDCQAETQLPPQTNALVLPRAEN